MRNYVSQEQQDQAKWVGVGVALGAGVGAAIGATTNNLGIGVALGTSGGLLTGIVLSALSAQKKKNG